MAVTTYYFNASDGISDPNTVWTDDANAFDGSTSTFADSASTGSTSSNYLQGDGTNAPTSGTSISQVRARMYASNGVYGTDKAAIYTDGLGEFLGEPIFNGGLPNWGSYVTLSTPSGGWTWQKVSDLEVKIYSTSTATLGVYRVEIEVTYADPAGTITGLSTTTGLSTITF